MKPYSQICCAAVLLILSGLAGAAEPTTAPAMSMASPTPTTIDIDNPPFGLFSDEWYVLMLNGQKSGHMHNTMEHLKRSSRDIIRTETSMLLEVGRDRSRISITFDQTTDETLKGEPLSFKNSMRLGKIPSVTTGNIKNGKVTVSTRQLGMNMGTNTYNLPKGAIMSWGTYREEIKRGLKPGLKYDLDVYEPSMSPDRLTPTTMEVFDKEEIDLFGRKVTAYRTRQTAHMKGGLLGGTTDVDTTAWITDDGSIVKMKMTVPPVDIPFEVIGCTKAVALAPNDPAELMVSTLIHIDRRLNRKAKAITYQLSSRNKKKLDLPETAMQKITERGGGSITLKLTRSSARDNKKVEKAAKTEESGSKVDLKPYLEASADLNYKDPKAAELARKAAGDEKDPHKLAERLCNFVHNYIQSKNLSVGFASASEVARSREGDCTEHGVLLAALGRACGIPTRIVTGIVYTDEFAGESNVFVGHLWTQYWIDGEWVDVDAAFNETDVDPTHIALGISAAGDAGIADLVTAGWMSLNKLSLKVLRAE